MPYIPNTPESLLKRTDSKDPATTCWGITNDGKRCRRPSSKSSYPTSAPNTSRVSNDENRGYCWQHKDQAVGPFISAVNELPSKIQQPKLPNRSSIDTLVDRLGLLDIGQRKSEEKKRPIHGRPKKERSTLSLFCCCTVTEDERELNPRPIRDYQGVSSSAQPAKRKSFKTQGDHTSNQIPQQPIVQPSSRLPQTGKILSLIPSSTSPEIASQLLAALAKSTSDKDRAGFIYMFWLTSESLPGQPPTETASSLLTLPLRCNPPEQKKANEVLEEYSTYQPNNRVRGISQSSDGKKKILLKIGRAENVHRRLNQWTKQCGYNLSLIRYYPYQPTNSPEKEFKPSSSQLIKVPNAHKVERLIHIEISSKRASHGRCQACNKVHKEWFEIDASLAGIKEIDDIIRRWVDWDIRKSYG